MTDSQIESAARKLCELRGINPDEMTSHEGEPNSHGFVPAIYFHSPAWTLVRKEVIAYEQIATAVAHAKAQDLK